MRTTAQISRWKIITALFVAGLCVGSWFIFFAPAAINNETSANSVPSGVAARAKSVVAARSDQPLRQADQIVVPTAGSKDFRVEYETAANIYDYYQKYIKGDATNQYYAMSAAWRCVDVVGDKGRIKLNLWVERARGTKDEPLRKAALLKIISACSGFDELLMASIESKFTEFQNESAAKGVIAAKLALSRPSPFSKNPDDFANGILTFTNALQQDMSRLTAAEAATYILLGRNNYVWEIGDEKLPVSSKILIAALDTIDCSAAAMCPISPLTEAKMCLTGTCGVTDRAQNIQQYKLTPAEYEVYERLRPQLTAGALTGKWPEGLLKPISLSPPIVNVSKTDK